MIRLLLLTSFLAGSALAQQSLSIVPATLPNGPLGSSYASSPGVLPTAANLSFIDLSLQGSSSQASYSINSGALPPGISLSSFGSLRGTPTQQGSFTFEVLAVTNQEQTVLQTFSITIGPPLSLSQTAVIGSSYLLPIGCPEFDTSYSYSGQGAIPAGLSVDSFTGEIFGVPTGPPGSSTFRWLCVGSGIDVRVDFNFTVQPAPSLRFTGQVGALLAENLVFGGGTAPFSYSVISGEPPPGVSVDAASGQLSGTPSSVGSYSFVVEKTDSFEDVYRANVTVQIVQGLSFTIAPSVLSLEAVADGPPVFGAAVVDSSQLGDSYSATVRTTSGGRWLSVTPARGAAPRVLQLRVDPTGLTPGQYTGTVDAQSASAAGPAGMAQLQVNLWVLPPAADVLTASPRGLETAFRQGGTPGVRPLIVSNGGSGPLLFDTRVSTANGGGWLRVTPSSGTVSGASPMALRVSTDPTGLPPGTYKGTIGLNAPAGGGFTSIPVTMTVSGDPGLLQLSQEGLSFRIEQGSGPLPAFFFVQEALGRVINWQAAATTTSGGAWLGVSPASGATGPQSSVDVSVSASRLTPGRYYGQISVSSSQAANSPQSATVALKVEPQGTLLPPSLGAKGLAFVAPPMLTNTLTRGVFVGNPTARAHTLQIATSFPGSPIFLTATVENPRIAPGGQSTLVVRVNASQLNAGTYRAFIDLGFASGGPSARLEVLLVVADGSPGGPLLYTESGAGGPRQTACTPTVLHALVVEPGDNFIVEQGQPVPIEALVVDDCGQVPTDAVVSAQFSNGDEPVTLRRNSRGAYSGLWTPQTVSSGVSSLKGEPAIVAQEMPPDDQDQAQITIQANQLNTSGGATQVGGSLSAAAGVPVISPGGAVSAASFASRNPLPPGAFISIFGGNLAPETAVASSLPLPTELNTVSVTAAGQPVALNFVSPGQINGVLPFGLTADTAQQIVVKHGNALSTPESVSVSQAQPAVFTQNFSGAGPGIVVGVKPDGTQFLVGPNSRLQVGDAAVIYCAGLGLVDQDVDAAQAAPGNPLARIVNGVSVTIGGVDAEVLYAGLAPGFAGLYQVNALVKAGTPSGATVPLVMTVNEIQNPVVTVAVQ